MNKELVLKMLKQADDWVPITELHKELQFDPSLSLRRLREEGIVIRKPFRTKWGSCFTYILKSNKKQKNKQIERGKQK